MVITREKRTFCVTFICDLKLSAFITPRVEREGDLFDAVNRELLCAPRRLIMKVHFDEEVERGGIRAIHKAATSALHNPAPCRYARERFRFQLTRTFDNLTN
jgi:hypothetical protein